MEKSVIMGAIFKVAGVFGVALLLAGKLMITIPGKRSISLKQNGLDGILTPAQSLLGAIQG